MDSEQLHNQAVVISRDELLGVEGFLLYHKLTSRHVAALLHVRSSVAMTHPSIKERVFNGVTESGDECLRVIGNEILVYYCATDILSRHLTHETMIKF